VNVLFVSSGYSLKQLKAKKGTDMKRQETYSDDPAQRVPMDEARVKIESRRPERAVSDRSFCFTLEDTGCGKDRVADVILLARLADGNVLPRWLSFDAVELTLSGEPPQDFYETLHIVITATSTSGGFKAYGFTLAVFHGMGVTLSDAEPVLR
jgi:hypothetical protein